MPPGAVHQWIHMFAVVILKGTVNNKQHVNVRQVYTLYWLLQSASLLGLSSVNGLHHTVLYRQSATIWHPGPCVWQTRFDPCGSCPLIKSPDHLPPPQLAQLVSSSRPRRGGVHPVRVSATPPPEERRCARAALDTCVRSPTLPTPSAQVSTFHYITCHIADAIIQSVLQ